jgi:hypothetical protein
MQTFYTKIADHILKITYDQPFIRDYMARSFQIEERCEHDLNQSDSNIHANVQTHNSHIAQTHVLPREKNHSQNPDLVIIIRGGYGIPFVNYDVQIMKTRTTIRFSRADYEIFVDSSYNEAMLFVHDQLALKHALMNLYSSFIVNQNWGLLLHSSCAIEAGMAHLFAGHSGAGKSTAARLSEPRELLSDEATLVKISPEGIRVFNSPFRSEINPTRFEGSYRLDSVQLLHQAVENRRNLIKKSDALLNLFDKVFYWTHSNKETGQVMRMLSILVDQVPVYDLEFQKNPSFWELIS